MPFTRSHIININQSQISQWIQCDCMKIFNNIIGVDDSEINYISDLT
jgi:hypothetical protein